MKKLKPIIALLMVVVTIGSLALPVYASGIMPAFVTCEMCGVTFFVEDDYATFVVDYVARDELFDYINIAVTIQKKKFFVFWETVEIGYQNNTWIGASLQPSNILSRDFSVAGYGYGTYRAIFEIDIYGNDGSVDEIDRTVEFEYREL